MFGNPYTYNSMPTSTQPYGYPINPYTNINTQPQQQIQTQTNKIYVNGIEDVRNRVLPSSSDYIFLDNDQPILYQKIVDSKGQFEVKAFSIIPYEPKSDTKQEVDLSAYVKKSDLEPLQEEIKALKEKLSPKKVEVKNGTTTINRPTTTI